MGGWFCEVVLWVFDFTACLMEWGRVGIGRRNTYDYIREGLGLRSMVIIMVVTVSMLPSPFVQMFLDVFYQCCMNLILLCGPAVGAVFSWS